MEDKRELLIANFKILRQGEFEKKQTFKALAYTKIIKALEVRTQPIIAESDLDGIQGLGKSTREKAEEIMRMGFTEKTKDAMQNTGPQKTIEELIAVMSIGNVKATSLVREHNVSSVDDLRSKVTQDPTLLNDKQKLGLKYHDDFTQRIPRSEMVKHKAFLEDTIASIDPLLRFDISGSFRRGAVSSGDIDVLVTHPSGKKELLNTIVESLQKKKYLYEEFAYGKEKYLGTSKLPRHKTFRRIDILFIDPSQYAFALLYFTGSQDFNIEMRNHALTLGWSLSEHGLKYACGEKKNEFYLGPTTFTIEEDIFRFLNVKFVDPIDRAKGVLQTC